MQMKLEFHQKSTCALDASKFLWNWEENYFCQRSSIRQALARCSLAISFILDSYCQVYLTAGETKMLKDIQLASARGTSKPRCFWPQELFHSGTLVCVQPLCHEFPWHLLGLYFTGRFTFSDSWLFIFWNFPDVYNLELDWIYHLLLWNCPKPG